jgi:phage terminase large subunit
MTKTLEIEVARVFRPLIDPSRYKGAWGGRGSGKSQFFAGLLVDLSIRKPGLRSLCCREIQKSLKESAKKLIEYKIEEYGVGHMFDVQESQIKTPGDGLIVFAGLQDHTAESIKSYEGFDVAWVEEAQTVSQKSLNLLRPTIRKPQANCGSVGTRASRPIQWTRCCGAMSFRPARPWFTPTTTRSRHGFPPSLSRSASTA